MEICLRSVYSSIDGKPIRSGVGNHNLFHDRSRSAEEIEESKKPPAARNERVRYALLSNESMDLRVSPQRLRCVFDRNFCSLQFDYIFDNFPFHRSSTIGVPGAQGNMTTWYVLTIALRMLMHFEMLIAHD